MAAHITTGYPTRYGDREVQFTDLQSVVTSLIDNVEWALCNLDAGNVIEAASVKAQNIDTTSAKIKSAQIKNLTADKISAGTINLSESITISGSESKMEITDNSFKIMDGKGKVRFEMSIDEDDVFAFSINTIGEDGKEVPAIYMDQNGEAAFSGNVDTYKDVSVGQSVMLRARDRNGGEADHAGISFYGAKGTEKASILAWDASSSTGASSSLKLTANSGTMTLDSTYGTLDFQTNVTLNSRSGDIIIRGSQVRLGSSKDNGVLVNGEIVASRNYVDDQIKKALQSYTRENTVRE